MLALAIDTSGDMSAVALATENQLVSEFNFRNKMDLLRRLMPNVDRIVSDAGKTQSDIDAVVISLGPGSFTGLRIGMAAAKGIAQALDRPIVGVSTLDVLAHGASLAAPRPVAALIHAKPGDVYWALYRFVEGVLVRSTEDAVVPLGDVVAHVHDEDGVLFVGDGSERSRTALELQFGPGAVAPEWLNYPRGAVLARLGIDKILAGEVDDVMKIAPSYVQRPTPVIRLEAGKFE